MTTYSYGALVDCLRDGMDYLREHPERADVWMTDNTTALIVHVWRDGDELCWWQDTQYADELARRLAK